MIFICADHKNRIIAVPGEVACAEKCLFKSAIAARGGYVGPGGFEVDGDMTRGGVVHGADEIGRTGKLFVRREEFR